jgi:hypothetical protein
VINLELRTRNSELRSAVIGAIALAFTITLTSAALVAQEPPKKADPPKALNIAGKWSMALDMSIGQATPALVFKQDGETLTGTYTGRYGTFEFKGTLKERALNFSFQMDTDGGTTTMTFAGEVSPDAQAMKGTGSIEGLGDVTWTAKRDKS